MFDKKLFKAHFKAAYVVISQSTDLYFFAHFLAP